jgi:hypothetical protein
MRSSLFILFIPLLCRLATARKTLSGHPILEPVSDDGWDDSVRRRSTNDSLTLLDHEHMVWNSAPGKPPSAAFFSTLGEVNGDPYEESADNIFVNMTIFTGEEELIISMERFSQQLSAVNCSQNMVMSFNSNTSYQSAIQSWDWVNFNEQRTFIMIANYPGCGADNSRQPWVVSNVDYDPTHLTVHLNATKKEWTEVAHTYNLDFGKYSSPTPSKARRMSFDKQINLDLTATLPASFTTSIGIVPDLNVDVTCSNCGTKGTLTLAGHVETSWWNVQTFTVTANPTGVQMDLNLAISASAVDPMLSFNPAPWDFFTLPLGGFEIPGLVTLGPELTLGAGFGITGVKGTATLSTSITGTIPDSSTAVINVLGDNQGATYSGWVPVWTAGPMDVSEKVSSSIEVFGDAKVGIALQVLGTGVELAFNLKVPDVALTATLTHGRFHLSSSHLLPPLSPSSIPPLVFLF